MAQIYHGFYFNKIRFLEEFNWMELNFVVTIIKTGKSNHEFKLLGLGKPELYELLNKYNVDIYNINSFSSIFLQNTVYSMPYLSKTEIYKNTKLILKYNNPKLNKLIIEYNRTRHKYLMNKK